MKIDRGWLLGAMFLHGFSNFLLSCGVFVFEIVTIPVFFIAFRLMLKNFKQYKASVGLARTDTVKTVNHLEIAVRNDPDNADLLHEYSFYLLKAGRLDEAVKACDRILELKFTDPAVRYLMAFLHVLKADFERAGSLYKEAFMYDRGRTSFEDAFRRLEAHYAETKEKRCLPLLARFARIGSDRTREMKYVSQMNAGGTGP
jgi:tetratricopeptide (TPR) repeat protein